MDHFTFYAPTYFAFGKGSQEKIGSLVRKFGGSKVLLHYGSGSVKRNGVYDAAVQSLAASGLAFVELGGVQPNPRSSLVYKGIELCRNEKVDFILAIGGGSVIDSAKAIAAGVVYEGDFWDYFPHRKNVEKALPVGTVLTIAAAGSEGSENSVITRDEGMLKFGAHGEGLRPKFSILNPEYTMSLGAYQTACGITDMFMHVVERYFTNVADVETTDRLCEGLMKAIVEEAPKVMANPLDYQARANIMWAGMVAHNNICGVGRVNDWASHGLQQELGAFNDSAHGAGLAVVAPAWMNYVVDHDLLRSAQFAVRVWGCDMNFADPKITALEGIARFRSFLDMLGMPRTLNDLGIHKEDIPVLVEHAKLCCPGELIFGNYVKLYADDIRKIYESLCE